MTPLQGLRVVEFEGIGPGPVAGMILSQLGADVTLLRRPAALGIKGPSISEDPIDGAKSSLRVDLKQSAGVELALKFIQNADVLIEGNRPGVMERLGLGPEVCATRNPRLVYGRMTGWGQSGPLAHSAGHDLNYVALTGLLSLSRRDGAQPIVPPTVIGDAAGALGLAFGLLAAVFEATRTGRGRVVDAAMVDISAMLGALVHLIKAQGSIDGDRPSFFHDSPFYDVYACSDGKSITVGALEPQFYALLLDKLGLSDIDAASQYDDTKWPQLKQRFAALFATRTRDDWCALLEGTDVCFAPVLSLDEAAKHPHLVARGTYQNRAGGVFAAPAPRFLGDYPKAATPLKSPQELLRGLGLDDASMEALHAARTVLR
jgi:alpha-methylacyl-CoA racemase